MRANMEVKEMIADLVIRPIEMKDAQQLRDHLYTRDTLEQAKELIAENVKKAEELNLLHIVAEYRGEIVGTAILIRNPHVLRSHRAEVAGLVVKYELWGEGIARRLVDECKTLAVGMGIELLEVGCRGGEPAEEIYKRLGFIQYSRLPDGLKEPWDEQKVFDEVYLYQRLAKTGGK